VNIGSNFGKAPSEFVRVNSCVELQNLGSEISMGTFKVKLLMKRR
jgi:hypothetical protein